MVMNNNPEIASSISNSLLYTLQMMIGEVNYAEMKFGEICNTTNIHPPDICQEEFKINSSFARYMGYILFLAFLFLVVIVLMNLLNAIAIGDVQSLRKSHNT